MVIFIMNFSEDAWTDNLAKGVNVCTCCKKCADIFQTSAHMCMNGSLQNEFL